MVGGAILRINGAQDYPYQIYAPSRAQLNLIDAQAVDQFFVDHDIDVVVHCAAKVGGIRANMDDMAGFYAENMRINLNVIDGARRAGVDRLLFLGSSCMYPKDLGEILQEDDLFAAPLEPTNEGYAIAKLGAARHCQYISQQFGYSYRCFVPCNLYGPGDVFHAQHSHLIPAMILKLHRAVQNDLSHVLIWGDGTPRRECLYVDDLASFILDILPRLDVMPAIMNTGYGHDMTVRELYEIAARVVGYKGGFEYDFAAPNGMDHKLMDNTRAQNFGWAPQTDIACGLAKTYAWFKAL